MASTNDKKVLKLKQELTGTKLELIEINMAIQKAEKLRDYKYVSACYEEKELILVEIERLELLLVTAKVQK